MAAEDAAFISGNAAGHNAVKNNLRFERAGRLLVFTALLAGLVGCGETPRQADQTLAESDQSKTSATQDQTGNPSTELSPIRMAQWARNCALCHVRGEGGAPVLGDEAAWEPRFAQGEDVLLQHTVEGLNNMPPLGYCMDCEEEDFRALIQFFTRSSGGAQPAGEES